MHAAPVSHNQQLVEMSNVQRLVHAAAPSRGHLRADLPLHGRVRRSSVKSGRGLNPISATSLVNTPDAARGAARLLQGALPYSPSVDRNRQSDASSSISSDQNSEVWNPSCGWSRLPHHLDETQIWSVIREEAARDAASEPALASFLHSSILAHHSVGKAMAFVLADKLMSSTLLGTHLMKLISDAYEDDPSILEATIADIHAVYYRDPACDRYSTPILYFKGFQALQCSRIAHWLWKSDRRMLAEAIWSRVCEVFHVDIHPGAWLGKGIFIDHATGVVIGETAMLGDNCSLLHHVTLGGSGSSTGIRHPCIGHGVLLGAGACVLGPVSVGAGTKIGAGTVVVTDLPSHCVAVGVPARVVRRDRASEPVKDMDQTEGFILDYVI